MENGGALLGRHPTRRSNPVLNRLVFEHQDEFDSQWAAISSVASKVGMTPETLRKWVRTAEIDGGLRAGVSTEERARIKELERENRELRRANEILKAAAAFFGGFLLVSLLTYTREQMACRPECRLYALVDASTRCSGWQRPRASCRLRTGTYVCCLQGTPLAIAWCRRPSLVNPAKVKEPTVGHTGGPC